MTNTDRSCPEQWPPRPVDADSNDPEVLRAALLREATDRNRAECIARMQTDVVKLAIDLLVREPDLVAFFGGLTKTMVEEAESHTCAVWLLDDDAQRCDLWLAYVKDQLYTPAMMAAKYENGEHAQKKFFCQSLSAHLVGHREGWDKTVEYTADDARLPAVVREFSVAQQWDVTIATPLVLGGRNLGWITLSHSRAADCQDGNWWRIVLIEAVAQQAALALHHSRVVAQSRVEERQKATLEERNRLARDIHDNLAQGFAAILMQLQGARREAGCVPPTLAGKLDTVVDIARMHLIEARRSVATLRPNVGRWGRGGLGAEAHCRERPAHHRRADRGQRRRTASFRRRRRARDHRDRAGGADQCRAPFARAAHHRQCGERSIDRRPIVGR